VPTLGSHRSFHWRLIVLVVFFLVLLAAIAARVFTLAIVEHRRYVLAADRQHQLIEVLPSHRGAIYAVDKTGHRQPLAIQKTVYTLVAEPKSIADPAALASNIAAILGADRTALLARISREGDPYEILAKSIDGDAAARIRELKAAGITLVEESRRNYPQNDFASALLGFVRYDADTESGEYGIERQYQSALKGERGFFEGERDATRGYWVGLGKRILDPPVDGDSVVLTIDPNIQFRVESELKTLVEKWQGESGLALVLDPKTGKILAAASQPSFDPNGYSGVKDYGRFRLALFDSQFELGSVMKPITMASALDAGAVTPKTTYTDPGTIAFGRYTISNFDLAAHGVQTMSQVIEKSLNTGAVFAGQKLGKERYRAYLERFGFGGKTGVDFPNEVAGDLSNLAAGRDIEYATASFGQGIAVTPVQLAMAVGAIANRGVLMRPYLVERIISPSGGEEVRMPVEVGRAITPETATAMTDMLVATVDNSFENRAKIKGYRVAGKTGTAQLPLPDRRGYAEQYIHSFVGFAPASDPRFLVFLQVVKPIGNRFAANTMTPAFHGIAEFILNYYEIPSDAAPSIPVSKP